MTSPRSAEFSRTSSVRAINHPAHWPTTSSAAGVVITSRLLDYWYYRSQTADAAGWLDLVTQALRQGLLIARVDELLALAAIASIRALQGRTDLATPFIDRALAMVGDVPASRRLEVGHALGRLASAVWSTDDLELLGRIHRAMATLADDAGDDGLAVFSDAIDCLLAMPSTAPEATERRATDLYARAMRSITPSRPGPPPAPAAWRQYSRGGPAEGLQWTDRIIDIHWRLGTRRGGWYLETRANLTSLAGNYEQAAALFAAARAHNKRGGIAWPRRDFTTDLQNRTAEALGEERFARAWRRGEQWSLADVRQAGLT